MSLQAHWLSFIFHVETIVLKESAVFSGVEIDLDKYF